jgi:hypothetical protein
MLWALINEIPSEVRETQQIVCANWITWHRRRNRKDGCHKLSHQQDMCLE